MLGSGACFPRTFISEPCFPGRVSINSTASGLTFLPAPYSRTQAPPSFRFAVSLPYLSSSMQGPQSAALPGPPYSAQYLTAITPTFLST